MKRRDVMKAGLLAAALPTTVVPGEAAAGNPGSAAMLSADAVFRRAAQPLDLKSALIIDAVGHAYDFSPSNRLPACPDRVYRTFAETVGVNNPQLESLEPGYARTLREFTSRWKAEDLVHALFVESDTDIVVHHSAALTMFFEAANAARWDTSLEMRRLAPERVVLYGYVDCFAADRGRVFDDMARQVEQGARGFKFYPASGFMDEKKGRFDFVSMRYDDREFAYPFFEHAYGLGIKQWAFHKALPFGAPLMDNLNPLDINSAALDFPDCTFEVVHDGITFLEESAWQLALYPNVYANLESVINLIVRQPRRLAYILGTLLQIAGSEKILYATGCGLTHPGPILQAFAEVEFGDACLEMGFPQLTPAVKRNILGENYARMVGLDAAATRDELKNDDWSRQRANWTGVPWEKHRKTANDPAYPWPGYATPLYVKA